MTSLITFKSVFHCLSFSRLRWTSTGRRRERRSSVLTLVRPLTASALYSSTPCKTEEFSKCSPPLMLSLSLRINTEGASVLSERYEEWLTILIINPSPPSPNLTLPRVLKSHTLATREHILYSLLF